MIIANLATYPPRWAFLANKVDAISPQVDQLNTVLYEYDSAPEFLARYKNFNTIVPESRMTHA